MSRQAVVQPNPARMLAIAMCKLRLTVRERTFMMTLGSAFSITEPLPRAGRSIVLAERDGRIAVRCQNQGLGVYRLNEDPSCPDLERRVFELSALGALWVGVHAAGECWDAELGTQASTAGEPD